MVYTGYELSGYSSDADTDKIKFERFERSRDRGHSANAANTTFKEQRNTHYTFVKTEPIHPDNANKVFDEMAVDPLLGKTQIGVADPETESKPQRLRTGYAIYDRNRTNEEQPKKSPRNDKKNYTTQ